MPLMQLFYAVSGNACVLISFHRFASTVAPPSVRPSAAQQLASCQSVNQSFLSSKHFASIVCPHRRVLVRRHSTVRLTFLLCEVTPLSSVA